MAAFRCLCDTGQICVGPRRFAKPLGAASTLQHASNLSRRSTRETISRSQPLQTSLGVLGNAGFAFRCGPDHGMTGKGMAGEHSDSP